jgi:hypothetical protein
MGDEGILSAAWLYKPFGSKFGVLVLADGRLSFILEGGKVVFEAPLDQVEVLGWPSYGIVPNSQVKLRVAGKKHRVSFIAPMNAPQTHQVGDLTAFGADVALLRRANRALRTYPAGMETGKAWRELLGPH